MAPKAMKRAASAVTHNEEQPTQPKAQPPASVPSPVPVVEEAPKVIMSKAQRRKLKKPPVIVTAAMKEQAREEKRELRKHLRMVKSNGGRRKLAKLREKREREARSENEEAVDAFDPDFRPAKKGRRLE